MSQTRRSFLKFIVGGAVGTAASPMLFKLTDDASIWTQNWSWIPRNPKGETTYELTTSKLCPSASGLKVRLVGGQPVRALPNPEHPLGGGLSALAAAEVQLMYSPARIKAPLKRSSDGSHSRISWDEALKMLEDGLKNAGSSIAAVSGDETGSSMEVLHRFLGTDQLYMMPSEAQAASRAWDLMGGSGQLGYDLEGCDFILAIGANFLESWGTFIRNRRLFAEAHPHGEDSSCTVMYAGPVQNNSAAVADKWISLKPGSETALALGLAALLVQRGRSVNSDDMGEFRSMLAEFTPQKVEGFTGVSQAELKALADALLKAEKPAVLLGSEFGQGGGAAPVMAGLALNLLLNKNVIKDLPLRESPLAYGVQLRKEVFRRDLAAYLANGPQAKALIFYEANPVYALPAPKKTAEAIKAVPFKVSFSAFMDETSSLCDLVLPMPLGLERLDDIETPYGCGKAFYALSRKVIAPLVDARHGMDVLLAVAAKLGRNLPYASYEDALKATARGLGADWDDLQKGEAYESGRALPLHGVKLAPQVLAAAVDRKSAGAAVSLAPMRKIAMGTAQTGIPPFNVKTIRGSELAGKEMSVFMNGATAYSRGGLRNGDRVVLSAGGNEIRARVHIYEGMVSDAIGVYLGFGHSALDEFSQNKGANVAELFTAAQESGTGLSVWNQTGVSVTKA